MIRFFVFLLTCLVLTAPVARAENFDTASFAKIPVQHEGRIKPIDTFSKSILYSLSGKNTLGKINANEWMMEVLFDPANALQRPVFKILRPQIINLPSRKNHLYSFAEIAPALRGHEKSIAALLTEDPKDWNQDQKEIMDLHAASLLYLQLLRSFSFMLPLNVEMPKSLAKELKFNQDRVFTYSDYRRHESKITQSLQNIIKKKGQDPQDYTAMERDIAFFAMNMNILAQSGENNLLLRILPQIKNQEWASPWMVQNDGAGSPQSAAYLTYWKDMAQAFQENDYARFAENAEKALAESYSFSQKKKLTAEYFYNKAHLLSVSLTFYILSFVGIIWFYFKNKGKTASYFFLFIGFLTHGAAIVLRIYVLERPPVGTLYESILFVSLICALIGLIYERTKKDGHGLSIGALSALGLLFATQGFGGDDTMKMLVAVLNTNFWLSTHVLCITIGYGLCIITSLLAHIWLIQTAIKRDAQTMVRGIKTLAMVSLLFTAFGTLLGGIWADQSWGRFWGWDPKENGALLIVLWLIWVLHGQIGGQLSQRKWIGGLAALSMIVAIAWFGVNLLGTGLHSYGFITGVAGALFAFCFIECLIIGTLMYKAKEKVTAP